jgi:hypothetical protein
MLLTGVWLNWLLQYVRNWNALADNEISVVVLVDSVVWNNRLVILLLFATEPTIVATTSKIPTILNDSILTLSHYVRILLSIIIIIIVLLSNQSIRYHL